MALVNCTGFETGTLATEGILTSGTTSLSTSTVRTGTYSLRCNPGVSGNGLWGMGQLSSSTLQEANFSIATVYARFYFRAATLPNSTQGYTDICFSRDSGATDKFFLRVNDTGHLRMISDGGSTVETTASSIISANTWYCIEVKIGTGTGTSAVYEVRVNGVTVLSGGMSTNSNNHARFFVGLFNAITNGSVDFFYDDFSIDDATWLGPGRVKRLAPTANGSTASWTSGTGSSDYTQVDEIPASNTDYIQCGTGAGDKVHLVDVTDAAAAGIAGAIVVNGVKMWAGIRENSSVTSSTKLRIRCNSTDSTTSGVNHSTTVSNRFFLRTTDPSDSAAWTIADLDDLEVGVVESNAVAVRCVVLSAFVDFNDSQTVSIAAIASAEELGAPRLDLGLLPNAVDSLEAFGAPTVSVPGGSDQTAFPAGVASDEALGAAQIQVFLSPHGAETAEGFGAPVVSPGAVTLLPLGIASLEALGLSLVQPGQVVVLPAAVGPDEAFGVPRLDHRLAPVGVLSAEESGAHAAAPGQVLIVPAGVGSAEALGDVALGLYLAPAGLDSEETFGPVAVAPASILAPAGIGSDEAHGVVRLDLHLFPLAAPSAEALGVAVVAPGSVSVFPVGVGPDGAAGAPRLDHGLLHSGIASGELFGVVAAAPGPVAVVVVGIGSGELFGAPALQPGQVVVLPAGIGSAEAPGLPALHVKLAPSGIGSAEAAGAPVLSALTFLLPAGIPSAESAGFGLVSFENTVIAPFGIGPAEAFGLVELVGVTVLIMGVSPARDRRYIQSAGDRRYIVPATARVFINPATGRVYIASATDRRYITKAQG